MNKQELLDLGIDNEEMIQKIIILHGKGIEKLKSDLEVGEKKIDNLSKQLEEANNVISDFKEMDIDKIKAAADEWKAKAEQIQADAEAEIQKIKFDSTLDRTLSEAKPRNLKAVKALLNFEDLKMSKEGEIVGLQEQISKLSEEHDYLFESNKPVPKIVAGATNSGVNVDTMVQSAREAAGLIVSTQTKK